MASTFFIAGAILCCVSEFKWMLIFGRIHFGFGVGFGNEAVPLFLTEIAPIQHRGAVNILFQLFVTIGIFTANLINYGTSLIHPHGWRISLGLAAVPGTVLLLGSSIITETPASLIQRGKEQEGKAALKKVRGVEQVDAEFHQIVLACEHGRQVKQPFKKIFRKSGIPALVVSNMIQVFQQFTGINAIMFYAPVLFQTLGFQSDASLFSSVITGLVNVCATFVSIYTVDKVGRRTLLLQACVQMFISMAFLSMLCHFEAYIFFFFSAWILAMGLFVLFLLPETKGVPIEQVEERLWKQHPVWKKFFKDEGKSCEMA
ncbi:hypothetical protein DH2020_049102 [Rehmannia glutinosa]|uniref:Major facilitator superfamily (MFS) profile domain-containing protein n=1 Tax=Rehmannia glutinosa TaxID=99300 RepID=A0ABR0U3Q6_REHGL